MRAAGKLTSTANPVSKSEETHTGENRPDTVCGLAIILYCFKEFSSLDLSILVFYFFPSGVPRQFGGPKHGAGIASACEADVPTTGRDEISESEPAWHGKGDPN